MPLVAASLMVHLALTSFVSVIWAFLAIRWLKIRYPAARALILAMNVLLPVGGLVTHFLYPQDCEGALGVLTHMACVMGPALGKAGKFLLAMGLVVAVSQLVASRMASRAIMRNAVPLESVTWDDQSVAARMRGATARSARASGRPAKVYVTENPGTCCTVGIVRPVVLISRQFCETMDGEELEAVLAHELAHVKRWDNGIELLATLLRGLTFFSPAAYLAIKQYLYEREKAADDLAVQLTGNPLALASAIIKVARSGPGMASANVTGDSKWGLTARVQRLLDGTGGFGSREVEGEGQGVRWLPSVGAAVAGLVAIALLLC